MYVCTSAARSPCFERLSCLCLLCAISNLDLCTCLGGAAGMHADCMCKHVVQDALGLDLTIPPEWYQRPRMVLLDAGMATHLSGEDQRNMVGEAGRTGGVGWGGVCQKWRFGDGAARWEGSRAQGGRRVKRGMCKQSDSHPQVQLPGKAPVQPPALLISGSILPGQLHHWGALGCWKPPCPCTRT